MARTHRPPAFDETPDDALPWGEILHRACLMLVSVVLFFTLINFIYDVSIAQPRLPLAPFMLALVIWLVGFFCRKLSAA